MQKNGQLLLIHRGFHWADEPPSEGFIPDRFRVEDAWKVVTNPIHHVVKGVRPQGTSGHKQYAQFDLHAGVYFDANNMVQWQKFREPIRTSGRMKAEIHALFYSFGNNTAEMKEILQSFLFAIPDDQVVTRYIRGEPLSYTIESMHKLCEDLYVYFGGQPSPGAEV